MITTLLAAVVLRQTFTQPQIFIRGVDRSDGTSISQTKTVRLAAEGKPDIWLVGVAHIGSKKYYSDLQAVLNARDVVLFEGVRRPGSPAVPTFDPKGPKTIYQILSDAVGLDFQLTDIDYSNRKWINSDLSMAQLDAISAKKPHSGGLGFDEVKQVLDPKSEQTQMFAQFFKTATPSVKEALKIFLVEKLSKAESALPGMTDASTYDLLLTDRNESVIKHVEALESASKPVQSIGIFYGAAHMSGIESALIHRLGYRMADQQWFTFAQADRRKLDASGKQFIDMLDKMSATMFR